MDGRRSDYGRRMAFSLAVSFAVHGAVALAFMPFEGGRGSAAPQQTSPVALRLRSAPPDAAIESPAAAFPTMPADPSTPPALAPAAAPADVQAAPADVQAGPADSQASPIDAREPTGRGGDEPSALIPAPAGPDPALTAAAELKAAVGRALRYPEAALRRGAAGRVAVELYLEPDGELRRAPRAVGSSGSALLDKAALDAAAAAAGRYTPPGRPLAVRIMILFEAGAAAALP